MAPGGNALALAPQRVPEVLGRDRHRERSGRCFHAELLARERLRRNGHAHRDVVAVAGEEQVRDDPQPDEEVARRITRAALGGQRQRRTVGDAGRHHNVDRPGLTVAIDDERHRGAADHLGEVDLELGLDVAAAAGSTRFAAGQGRKSVEHERRGAAQPGVRPRVVLQPEFDAPQYIACCWPVAIRLGHIAEARARLGRGAASQDVGHRPSERVARGLEGALTLREFSTQALVRRALGGELQADLLELRHELVDVLDPAEPVGEAHARAHRRRVMDPAGLARVSSSGELVLAVLVLVEHRCELAGKSPHQILLALDLGLARVRRRRGRR